MQRKRFERRFKRGISFVAALYVLAMVVAPEHTTLASAPVPAVGIASQAGMESAVRIASQASMASAVNIVSAVSMGSALPSSVAWRPAPQVASRKKGYQWPKASKPFGIDTVKNVPRVTLTRWHSIYKFATRYGITVDLARKIHDNAINQGIEPELGFRVVQMESEFKTRANSPVGAIGLTQLMLGTARGFEPNVTRESLRDAETNLRIGFKYLRALIRENDGNLSLALLVYNRGPVAVQSAMALGLDPSNGYDRLVTKGYRGRGTLD